MENIKCVNPRGIGQKKRAITSHSPFYAHSYFPEIGMSPFQVIFSKRYPQNTFKAVSMRAILF